MLTTLASGQRKNELLLLLLRFKYSDQHLRLIQTLLNPDFDALAEKGDQHCSHWNQWLSLLSYEMWGYMLDSNMYLHTTAPTTGQLLNTQQKDSAYLS